MDFAVKSVHLFVYFIVEKAGINEQTTDPRKPANVCQGSLPLDLYQFGQAASTHFSLNIILPPNPISSCECMPCIMEKLMKTKRVMMKDDEILYVLIQCVHVCVCVM